MMRYTQEHIDFVRDNVQGTPDRLLADMFNKKFGTNIPHYCIKNIKAKHKFSNGLVGGQFQKGQVSWNKGKKGMHYSPATEFKKGNIPVNHRPVGSERLSKDGYIEIKVTEPNKWRLKHRVIWEQANGKIPKSHKLIFADGNKENVAIENLLLVTSSELLLMNRKGLCNSDPDITKSGAILAKVIDKTNKRMRQK